MTVFNLVQLFAIEFIHYMCPNSLVTINFRNIVFNYVDALCPKQQFYNKLTADALTVCLRVFRDAHKNSSENETLSS